MWEKIPGKDAMIWRLKVPEGWLVRSTMGSYGSMAMTFVPDKEHLWEI